MFTLVMVSLASAVAIRQRAVARRRGFSAVDVFPSRVIPAYELLPRLIGQAVEADHPILISSGGSQIGDQSTLVTLSALTLTYYTAQEMSVGETAPILVTNQLSVVPLGYDMLERAYYARNLTPRSDLSSVRWYGTLEDKSLVFAAMMTVVMQSEKVSGTVLLGRFGKELGLVLGAAQRKGVGTIAGSDDIVGQAIAYGMADAALIGEEIFSPVGYLEDTASAQASLVTADFLRGALIVIILIIAVVQAADVPLFAPLFDSLGG